MASQHFGPSIEIDPVLGKNTPIEKNWSGANFSFQMDVY